MLGDVYLGARQQTRCPAAGAANRFVRRRVLPDRDADERGLQRQRHERTDRQPEALAFHRCRDDGDRSRKAAHHFPQLIAVHEVDDMGVTRRDVIELGVAGVLFAAAAGAHFADATPVLTFALAAVAIAILARLVGTATEQLGSRVGSSAAGAIQSALGNLPELFIALFALHQGLTLVVQSALVGSVIANSVLVLGLAFIAGGLRHGTQTFDSPRARLIATLTILAPALLAVPTLYHRDHTNAASHEKTLSLICAG